jgi:hypothetical protein
VPRPTVAIARSNVCEASTTRRGDDVILGECLELDQGLIGGHDASDESKHGKRYNDRRGRCCNQPSDQPRRIARLTHTTDVSVASSLAPFADT